MARRDTSDRERTALFQAAVSLGFTTLDTAPLYGFGAAELQIRDVLTKVARGSVQVLTKAGLRWDGPDQGAVHFEFTDSTGARRTVRRNSRPESLRFEAEQSLTRLGVERLDLLQLHFRDPTTPIADSIGELLRLREEGKIAHIGVCNFTRAELEETIACLGGVPLASVQSKYNLLQRAVEEDILPWCRASGIPFLAYSPLAEGLLALKDPAVAAAQPRRVRHFLDDTLRTAAARQDAAPATLALQWLMEQPGVKAPIVGISSKAQLKTLYGTLTTSLDPGVLRQLTATISGVHLPESWEGGWIRQAAKRIKKKFLYGSR